MRLLIFVISTLTLLASPSVWSNANCPKPDQKTWLDSFNALKKACAEADLVGDDGNLDECHEKIEACSDAQKNSRGNSCDVEVYKACGAAPGEIERIADNREDDADRSEEKAEDQAQQAQQAAQQQQQNNAGHMDKIMEALKEKSQADEDFAKTKRDIEKEQIDDERQHKEKLNELRGDIAERLKTANEQDISLSNQQLDMVQAKIDGAKGVRDSILAVQSTCRDAKRQFERDFIQQTREIANSPDPAIRGQLRAGSISEASALESRVMAERDSLYDQCMEDGQEAIQESRTANQEIQNMVQERLAQLERSKENNRQHKQQMDEVANQNAKDSAETMIRNTGLRQGQIQDAEAVRQNKHQNAELAIQMTEKQMEEEKMNNMQNMLSGLGGLGGGGGAVDGTEARERARNDQACADDLRSIAGTVPETDLRKVVPKYNTWKSYHSRCEGTQVDTSTASGDSGGTSPSRSPSSGSGGASGLVFVDQKGNIYRNGEKIYSAPGGNENR